MSVRDREIHGKDLDFNVGRSEGLPVRSMRSEDASPRSIGVTLGNLVPFPPLHERSAVNAAFSTT